MEAHRPAKPPHPPDTRPLCTAITRRGNHCTQRSASASGLCNSHAASAWNRYVKTPGASREELLGAVLAEAALWGEGVEVLDAPAMRRLGQAITNAIRYTPAPLPPAQPAEPRAGINAPKLSGPSKTKLDSENLAGEQKQLGKEGVGAAPEGAGVSDRSLAHAFDPECRVCGGQKDASDHLPPLPAKPKRSDGWDGQPEALAAYLRGAPPAAAVPEAGAPLLHRMLEKATVRLEILRDRAEGCDGLTAKQRAWQKGHALTRLEVPGWIKEQRDLLLAVSLRALSSPSGDARPTQEWKSPECGYSLVRLLEGAASGYSPTVTFGIDLRAAVEHFRAHPPVAPSIPEEPTSPIVDPKAASQKEGRAALSGLAPSASDEDSDTTRGTLALMRTIERLDHESAGFAVRADKAEAEVLRLTKERDHAVEHWALNGKGRLAAESEAKALREALAVARKALDRDKTGLGEGLNKVRTIARGYSWIQLGEWSGHDYTEQNEATLRKEVGGCLSSILTAVTNALHDSGNLATESIRAIDRALAPTNPSAEKLTPTAAPEPLAGQKEGP